MKISKGENFTNVKGGEMMKKKHYLIIGLLILFMAAMLKVLPITLDGYQMYKEAVSEKSIEQAVSELKSDKDYVKLDEISPIYLQGVIDSEDQRFYKHGAIDLISIGRAVIKNVKTGSFAEGGSTITQQLAKNMYFSFDKKLERKVAEVLVANELEKQFSKDEILEMYCNVVYFGEGCYGLGEATYYYYGVAPDQLTESQAKALIRTLRSPNHFNPKVYDLKI